MGEGAPPFFVIETWRVSSCMVLCVSEWVLWVNFFERETASSVLGCTDLGSCWRLGNYGLCRSPLVLSSIKRWVLCFAERHLFLLCCSVHNLPHEGAMFHVSASIWYESSDICCSIQSQDHLLVLQRFKHGTYFIRMQEDLFFLSIAIWGSKKGWYQ